MAGRSEHLNAGSGRHQAQRRSRAGGARALTKSRNAVLSIGPTEDCTATIPTSARPNTKRTARAREAMFPFACECALVLLSSQTLVDRSASRLPCKPKLGTVSVSCTCLKMACFIVRLMHPHRPEWGCPPPLVRSPVTGEARVIAELHRRATSRCVMDRSR